MIAGSKQLGPKYEICAVQTPGRWNRYQEPPISHFPTLVDLVTTSLQEYFSQPFALFGHSVGALLAFEVARDLRRGYFTTEQLADQYGRLVEEPTVVGAAAVRR